jgi:dihydroflavonol-4-reductase
MDACILYPSAVIGINDFKPSAAGEEILSTMHKKFFFYIDGGYNFIDVTDVAQLTLLSINQHVIGSVILGGYNISIHQLYREINRVLHKKALYIPVPKWLAIFYSKFSKRFPEVMLQAVFDNYDYDLSKMHELFLYPLKPINQTIEDTVLWIQKNFDKQKR